MGLLVGPEFCQPQLADHLAVLLFPYREGGIKLPTTLKRWQNPGKPGSKRINQMPMKEPSLLLAVEIENDRDAHLKMLTEYVTSTLQEGIDLLYLHVFRSGS